MLRNKIPAGISVLEYTAIIFIPVILYSTIKIIAEQQPLHKKISVGWTLPTLYIALVKATFSRPTRFE